MKIYIIFLAIILVGCKEKRVSEFEYTLDQGKICAIKPKDIYKADGFGLFDSFFKSKENMFYDNLSVIVYKDSLNNLNNKSNKYIFCFFEKELKYNFLETRIMLEIKKGKYMRQYEFVNYSCLSKDKIDLNLSNNQAIKECG